MKDLTKLADWFNEHLKQGHRGVIREQDKLILFVNRVDETRTTHELATVFAWLNNKKYELLGFASGTTGCWVIVVAARGEDRAEVGTMDEMMWNAWGKACGDSTSENWLQYKKVQRQVALGALAGRPAIPKRLLQDE